MPYFRRSLDSSTITCLAAQYYDSGEPLKGFNGSFSEGAAYDESHYANIVSDWIFRRALFELFQRLKISWKTMEKIIYFMDHPVAGPGVFSAVYGIKNWASRHVKVVLGGQGGDEIFCRICQIFNRLFGRMPPRSHL